MAVRIRSNPLIGSPVQGQLSGSDQWHVSHAACCRFQSSTVCPELLCTRSGIQSGSPNSKQCSQVFLFPVFSLKFTSVRFSAIRDANYHSTFTANEEDANRGGEIPQEQDSLSETSPSMLSSTIDTDVYEDYHSESSEGQKEANQLLSDLDGISEESEAFKEQDSINVNVEKIGNNTRRISATIPIEAPLQVVWDLLTDYEKLADFIPGLAVSQLLDKWEDGARLLQIGRQDLAFGLKFEAKGIVDVREDPVEVLTNGIRRDIDFEMIEGDFQLFQGTWRMEEVVETSENLEAPALKNGVKTFLSYILDVQPKIWLPVALVEGRLSKEIQINLRCVRDQAINCVASLQEC